MPEQDKLGTPDSQAGDASEGKTAGAASEDGQGGLPQKDIEKLNLAQKIALEAERERSAKLERELAEAKARLTPAGDAEDDETIDDETLQGVEHWAGKNDPVAKLTKKALAIAKKAVDENRRLVRDIATLRQLDKISDDGERDEVYKRVRETGLPVQSALAEVRGPKLAKENEELRAEVERLRQEPPRDVVRTVSGKDYTTSGKAVPTTVAEFDERMRYLEATEPKAATQLSRDYANGKIKLKDD